MERIDDKNNVLLCAWHVNIVAFEVKQQISFSKSLFLFLDAVITIIYIN
jgi:hypothetical protein